MTPGRFVSMRGYPGVLIALLLAVFTSSCAESPDERSAGDGAEGPAVLSPLGPEGLSALRDSFNAAVDRPRILVMLSPT